jgi:hypothetical protein
LEEDTKEEGEAIIYPKISTPEGGLERGGSEEATDEELRPNRAPAAHQALH